MTKEIVNKRNKKRGTLEDQHKRWQKGEDGRRCIDNCWQKIKQSWQYLGNKLKPNRQSDTNESLKELTNSRAGKM